MKILFDLKLVYVTDAGSKMLKDDEEVDLNGIL
jgi:hypothetical protein